MGTIVTGGGGANVFSDDYVTAAATPDGTLLIAYVPPDHAGTITIDMSLLSAPARARWFNPTTAAYTVISSSLPNTGTHIFTPPGNNGSGFSDWALVLDVEAGPPVPAVSRWGAALCALLLLIAGGAIAGRFRGRSPFPMRD